MSPLYDFFCDVCKETVEVIVTSTKLNDAIPHKSEKETKCLGMLRWEGITGFAVAGNEPLDGRHQTRAIMYQGEQKVGYVDGQFGKEAKRKK